jgi:hypothetical protein
MAEEAPCSAAPNRPRELKTTELGSRRLARPPKTEAETANMLERAAPSEMETPLVDGSGRAIGGAAGGRHTYGAQARRELGGLRARAISPLATCPIQF